MSVKKIEGVISEATNYDFLTLQVTKIGGAEKAVPHMTSTQFDLFEDTDKWTNFVKYLTDDQIASLTAAHLKSMGSKVGEIPNINKISIDVEDEQEISPFMSIDHKDLTPEQLKSLDVDHIQELIVHDKLSSLGDNVPHLNAENLAEAASNIDDISTAKLALDKLSQEQINELISRKDAELDKLDTALQERYVKNHKEEADNAQTVSNPEQETTPTEAAAEAAVDSVAETAAIISSAIVMLIIIAVIIISTNADRSKS